MSYLNNLRRCAGLLIVLNLGVTTGWAQSIQSISPFQATRIQRPFTGPAVYSSAPQGAKLVYQDSTNLSPFASCTANQAWPWTAQYSPDGNHLYVPLFGGFTGQGGCTLLKLDASSMQHLATIQVQESPEEVVFSTDASGLLARGFVTNSSASSVTVFDANDQVLGHIPIPVRPGNTFGSAFPFGMAVSPDQSTVWVGTSGGRIFALDVASLALDLNRTIDLGPEVGFARFAFMGNLLVLPATQYHQSYLGSTAKLIVMDPALPSAAQELVLATSPSAAAFPSPQDLAIHNGKIYVAGFDMGPQVFVVDPQSLTLDTTLSTGTGNPQGKFQALNVTPAGMLLVADFTTAEIARIDTFTGHMLGIVPAQFHGFGPQELTVSPDGQTLILPMASDVLLRFQLQ
ncbi:MAG: DNA-binding beta-propeller fold protein YncE [Planctomycetota bacterium]|jgi:DNA-binding beta-propeller fold protein YncE